MFYKRFRFVKELKQPEGTFKVGDEITIMEGRLWFNNGMVQPVYRDLLMDLVEYESNEGWNYLREIPIPYNKA